MARYEQHMLALVPFSAVVEAPDNQLPLDMAKLARDASAVGAALHPTAQSFTVGNLVHAQPGKSLDIYTCGFCNKSAPKRLWGPGWVTCPSCGRHPPSAAEAAAMETDPVPPHRRFTNEHMSIVCQRVSNRLRHDLTCPQNTHSSTCTCGISELIHSLSTLTMFGADGSDGAYLPAKT